MPASTDLPALLAAYLDRNVPAAARGGSRVLFSQTGAMCLKPGGRWSPFTAEQWMATDAVSFCWHARIKMAPLLTAVVEDACEDGHGRLDVKLWGALPLSHEEGPRFDQGEAQRYLAELTWNPVALLRNPALRFEERSDGAVRVQVGDPDTWVDLRFDAAGDIVGTWTEARAYGDKGVFPWEGRFEDYTTLGGIRLPRRGAVSWHLPEGPFCYWRGEIVDLELRD
ncbi:MAG: hypothetical protein H6739_28705 [Alphaproteobacteria bacterium]|nr:hypothetical protein [Alphaproteobacteria bacterium]